MTSASRIVVMDDDAALRSVLVRALAEEGYAATAVASGSALLDTVRDSPPDALILDVGMPDCDGRDVCRSVRATNPGLPVIMLTARDTLSDRLAGFDAGSDDYLAKPFALAELMARLEALLRRAGPADSTPVSPDMLHLDPVTFHVSRHGQSIRLTPTEYRLLARFAAEPGAVVSRSDLKRAGWPRTGIVSENTLDVYLGRLRKHLRTMHGEMRITKVPHAGYRFEC